MYTFMQAEFPEYHQVAKSIFPCKKLLGGIFHFHLNFNRTLCGQTVNILGKRRILVAFINLGMNC